MSTTYNSYRKTPQEMWESLQAEALLGPDGGFRWKSSGNCVPKDYVEIAGVTGEALARHQAAYDAETEKAVAQYREQREKHGYSAEELYEMRAAFGDEPVVDVLTGKRVDLYPKPRKGGRK